MNSTNKEFTLASFSSPVSKQTDEMETSSAPINWHDDEKGVHQGFETESAAEMVTWDSDDDPQNPLNWPGYRRLTVTILLSFGGLVSLMSVSFMAPALTQISEDLQISPATTSLTLSIYLLAFALGPLLIGPLSEMYGRKWVWIGCHVWFILWNAVCPVNKSKGFMIAGRLMSGLGGSVGIALPSPITADIWRPENRGRALALSMFAPYLGAAIGPILGGVICQNVSWRWLFWTVSIFDSALTFMDVFLIHESYAPVLLARKSKRLTKATGIKHATVFERDNVALSTKIIDSLKRPFMLLLTRPIIHLIGFFIAYNFGAYCIALTTFASIWTEKYGQSVSISGLHYISISLGSTFSSQAGGYMIDRVWAYFKAKKGGDTVPEYRVPVMLPGTLMVPAGLLLWGWAAEYKIFWIVVDAGVFLFTCGVMSSSQAMNAYLIDEFGEHTASATAGSKFLSNLMGFIFPIFAPQLYITLGHGWGNTLLGLLFLVVGLPIPLILWKWGPKIRAMGRSKEGNCV